jgi:uncharacterized protein (UPF0264 family)
VKLLGLQCARPGLLVSVRSADEARAALAGGADIVDVKDPTRGALGAADPAIISDVLRAVDRRVPVTAALGELMGVRHFRWFGDAAGTESVAIVKFGLAGCAALADWRSEVRYAAAVIRAKPSKFPFHNTQVVIVAYVDWQAAGAPSPYDVFETACEIGCPAVLLDTRNKSGGTLFDHFDGQQLPKFVRQVQTAGLAAVIAGSLSAAQLGRAVETGADIIAVRGAACEGGRAGRISSERVRILRERITTAKRRPSALA